LPDALPPPAPPDRPAGDASVLTDYAYPDAPPPQRRGLHLFLFLATFASCVFAGITLVGRGAVYAELGWWPAVADGLRYAGGLLGFLTVHEFGHYFAAKRHRVGTSLPYYIPLPLLGIGTLGAVIRIYEPIKRTRALFDIGAAGPLAGFVVALGVLAFALVTLPDPAYLLGVGGPAHAEIVQHYAETGAFAPVEDVARGDGTLIVFGQTPLFWLLGQTTGWMPPMYEVYHYPWLLAGWLGLFFTALNLLPAGQLDGGHILHATLGPRVHAVVARVTTLLLLASGTLGFVHDPTFAFRFAGEWAHALRWLVAAALQVAVLRRVFRDEMGLVTTGLFTVTGLVIAATWAGLAGVLGWTGWLIWALLIAFVIRVDHPPTYMPEKLTPGRKVLAVVCLLIFLSCFSIRPFYVL
jgi:membrane-associated protease RseP (regulator of RpoE activity)